MAMRWRAFHVPTTRPVVHDDHPEEALFFPWDVVGRAFCPRTANNDLIDSVGSLDFWIPHQGRVVWALNGDLGERASCAVHEAVSAAPFDLFRKQWVLLNDDLVQTLGEHGDAPLPGGDVPVEVKASLGAICGNAFQFLPSASVSLGGK